MYWKLEWIDRCLKLQSSRPRVMLVCDRVKNWLHRKQQKKRWPSWRRSSTAPTWAIFLCMAKLSIPETFRCNGQRWWNFSSTALPLGFQTADSKLPNSIPSVALPWTCRDRGFRSFRPTSYWSSKSFMKIRKRSFKRIRPKTDQCGTPQSPLQTFLQLERIPSKQTCCHLSDNQASTHCVAYTIPSSPWAFNLPRIKWHCDCVQTAAMGQIPRRPTAYP